MDKSTVSTALKFLGEIGILGVPKAGNYIVPEEVVDWRTKVGEVQRESRREVESRLNEYPLYKEAKFMLGLGDFTLEELVEDVSGSAAVAASKDELRDVKRSLSILAELGFLEVDEEGRVSVPDDLEGGTEAEAPEEGTAPEADASTEPESAAQPSEVGDGAAVPQNSDGGTVVAPQKTARLAVDMDISMDVTDMGADEVREKLEVINEVLGKDEE
jgi:hypothetical protein